MKRILIVFLIFALLLSVFSVISTAQTGEIRIGFKIKQVGFDQNWNSYRMVVNISASIPGNVVYLEEFYTIDGESHPKFVTSSRTEGGDLVKTGSTYNASFAVLRPVPHGGKTYTLVKAVIILNGKRVFEYWLTKNKDFIDNTGTDDDNPVLSELQNIDKYETRDGSLISGKPVLFKYTSLEVISEINVTGKGYGDISLRVELLKGRPGNTAKPNGSVYRYIDTSADSSIAGEISPKYRVENSWMVNRSIPDMSIRLFGWDGTGKNWVEMPTRIIDKDNQYTYFESVSPSTSSFAIIGFSLKTSKNSSAVNKTSAKQGTDKTAQNNSTENKQEEVKEPLIKNIPGFGFVSTVAALFLIFRYLREV